MDLFYEILLLEMYPQKKQKCRNGQSTNYLEEINSTNSFRYEIRIIKKYLIQTAADDETKYIFTHKKEQEV